MDERTPHAHDVVNEVAALRHENARLAERLARLEGALASPPAPVDTPLDGEAPVSRRRMFGLLGGAAATGAGLALAGASPAGADNAGGPAIGFHVSIASDATFNNAGGAVTAMTSSSANSTFIGDNSVGGAGLQGISSSGAGVIGTSGTGAGVSATTGSTSSPALFAEAGNTWAAALNTTDPHPQLNISLGTDPGPLAGTHSEGDFYVDQNGVLWYAPTSTTWINLSGGAFVPLLPTPIRVFNSATSGGPFGINEERAINVTGTFAAGTIPAGISAVLTNLAANTPSATGFLAMFEDGVTWSGTSNLNFVKGQTISNTAVSAVSPTVPGKVRVRCGGASTNVVVDVFGYYL